ncbi:interleukin-17 receptor E isoform X3 [Pongo abelii]|uniref:interleukin-17 receptor E isoform X3 n=1 Tax=Pongo abelii TaxID=9601 RepID=UPI003007B177
MGSSRPAALLLPLLLVVIDLSDSAGIGFRHLPHWNTRCPLASHTDDSFTGLQWGFFHLLVQKSKKSSTFKFCRRHKMPAPAQRKLLPSRHLSEKSHHISIPSPDISHKGLRSKRTQPSDPEAWESLPRLDSQRHGGPEFSFDLLPEARAIRVTISSGPEVSVRLCHQWALECEELSSPYDVQKIVSGGHTVELPYEFLLPCLCIEASYLQEDTVRRKKCPFQSWPEALVCFGAGGPAPPALLQGTTMGKKRCGVVGIAWSLLTCHSCISQFSFGNSSHVECPHQTGSLTSWNVSMDTQAQQLILHFSSRMHATFSAAWSHPGLGQDTLVPPVYTVSQARGSSSVTLDLIIPFLRPGCCVLVWRSDVQFAWKHLLCPDVSYRHLGLLILALLALLTLLGVVLALTCRRSQSGPGPARPVLLLHAADSEAQRRLVGALAELLRAALGGGRDVIVDLWEGRHVARVGPLPWLWAARARVAREQGTVLLLWSGADLRPASGPDPRAAPLLALLHAAPRPLLLLAYFSRLCAKGDIPPPLRALPRYRLLRDLPRLLRALDARPSAEATSWGRLGARQRRQSRLELCSRLEREAARLADLG